jgi:hypothetical protein
MYLKEKKGTALRDAAAACSSRTVLLHTKRRNIMARSTSHYEPYFIRRCILLLFHDRRREERDTYMNVCEIYFLEAFFSFDIYMSEGTT